MIRQIRAQVDFLNTAPRFRLSNGCAPLLYFVIELEKNVESIHIFLAKPLLL